MKKAVIFSIMLIILAVSSITAFAIDEDPLDTTGLNYYIRTDNLLLYPNDYGYFYCDLPIMKDFDALQFYVVGAENTPYTIKTIRENKYTHERVVESTIKYYINNTVDGTHFTGYVTQLHDSDQPWIANYEVIDKNGQTVYMPREFSIKGVNGGETLGPFDLKIANFNYPDGEYQAYIQYREIGVTDWKEFTNYEFTYLPTEIAQSTNFIDSDYKLIKSATEIKWQNNLEYKIIISALGAEHMPLLEKTFTIKSNQPSATIMGIENQEFLNKLPVPKVVKSNYPDILKLFVNGQYVQDITGTDVQIDIKPNPTFYKLALNKFELKLENGTIVDTKTCNIYSQTGTMPTEYEQKVDVNNNTGKPQAPTNGNIIDWIMYIINLITYYLSQLVQAISGLIIKIFSLIEPITNLIKQAFNFLPPEINVVILSAVSLGFILRLSGR